MTCPFQLCTNLSGSVQEANISHQHTITPPTPPSRLVAKYPTTRALHAELKAANPRWRFCPDCDLPLPDIIDLITPPRPIRSTDAPIQARTLPNNATHSRTAPALIIPGPRPIGSLISSTETAIRDQHRSERETRKPKNTLSAQIGITLYSGEYTTRSVGGLTSRDYVQIVKHSKYQTQPLELTRQYPSHRDLIYNTLQQLHIRPELLCKEWRIIQSVTLGNGAGVTELAADVESLTSIRAVVLALRAKKTRDDNEDKYNIMFIQDQEVEVEEGAAVNRKGKKGIVRTRPVQQQDNKGLGEQSAAPLIKQEQKDQQDMEDDQKPHNLNMIKQEEDKDGSGLVKSENWPDLEEQEQVPLKEEHTVSCIPSIYIFTTNSGVCTGRIKETQTHTVFIHTASSFYYEYTQNCSLTGFHT